MRARVRSFSLVALAIVILILPAIYLLGMERRGSADSPLEVAREYLQAVYSRDFKRAYGLVSSADRKLKPEQTYVRERGPFSGFAQQIARKLAEDIQVKAIDERATGDRLRLKLAIRVPDANSVAPLVMDWDEARLNGASPAERQEILAKLERLRRNGGLTSIEVEEDFALVRENDRWKVFLDWATGIQVRFDADARGMAGLEARPLAERTVVRPNDLFTVSYKVANRTDRDIFTRIVHRFEPQQLAEHVEIVECALLLPVRLEPGEAEEYSATYFIGGDLPENAREFRITYEFRPGR